MVEPSNSFEKVSFFDEIDKNKRNSSIFLFFMFFLFFCVVATFSFAFGLDIIGIIVGFIFLLIYAYISYFSGDKIVLSISQAKEADPKQYIFLHNTVEGLAIAAQIPKPKVYVINDPSPNAFATGRDPEHASIAVTTGLLEICNRQEVEGVVGHEISHIANYDIRFVMLAVVFAGAIAILSDVILRATFYSRGNKKGGGAMLLIAIVFMILAPIFAELVKFAISRQREYLADSNGARITRYPEGLASALEKISKYGQPVKAATESTAPLYFSNPTKSSLFSLFATHPPIKERIKKLRSM